MADVRIPHPSVELLSFIDSLHEPHLLLDRSYRIVAANAAYRVQHPVAGELHDYCCYEVSHRYTVPCDRAGESCPLARSLASGQAEHVVHLHHGPEGRYYEKIELFPVHDGSGQIAWFVERFEPMPLARVDADAHGLIGVSPSFQSMLEYVSRAAPSDCAVLLQGESGTGKEMVAQTLHAASRRARGPFVAVDCSGLPETLFESELFGHERGAFTGASTRKAGLVEVASGGTLFLDELGDIPLSLQVKLLRLLETGTFRRVGSTELLKADVRLVSATHRSLQAMVAEGRFRADLFYRVNTFPIRLPPLRERGDDIPLLVQALLARVAPGRTLRLSDDAMAWLQGYGFPGNVRELRNVLERASLLCDGETIQTWHLPEAGIEAGVVATRPGPRRIGPEHVAEALKAPASRKRIAAELGISERTLYRRLRALQRNAS